ncbi:hypothetical protein GCM10010218_60140 [Streptomyces mashuensis]|uniref:Orc1-like AAA ATPase domain-containing protein n=1 Tax=Streptomyces mashuensis TaxID=33904 RepID=A0A919B959_9ACTN|nr:tetratricopeptide repeat protein [Streptomyces mashuensis]GHF70810.1 hypothetical protein GCM10010218_60140 [Streptomyces mashuensis]
MDGDPNAAGGDTTNVIGDGGFFHTVVQGRNITIRLPWQVPPAMAGLPPASPAFTGRDTELAELLHLLEPNPHPNPNPNQQPPTAAVAGLAGVGKTELVLQAADRALRAPGWFPGGALFIDLAGYDPARRVGPEGALDQLLRALGLPDEVLPEGVEDRSRLYRSVLAACAAQGRRVLVVVDNAASAEQVRPLLPADGTTAALVTSRHTLDIDARLFDLDVLEQPESVRVLRQALHERRGPHDTRVDDAPADAERLAGLCAGLPLALRIAAALLADVTGRPLADLADDLEAAHTRLDHLAREERAVRAAFDLSYRHLTGPQARLFRLLPLNPGPHVSTEAVTRLAGAEKPAVKQLLLDLARAHLVVPGSTWGRWGMHDLVRLYADEQGTRHAEDDEREDARDRLFEHYLFTAVAAGNQAGNVDDTPLFPTPEEALAWLEEERPNLTLVATTAAAVGRPTIGLLLGLNLAHLFERRRYFDDWLAVTDVALTTARSAGDRRSEGRALDQRANCLRLMRRFEEAVAHHHQAAAVFRELGDMAGEASALGNLGVALRRLGRFDEAVAVLSAAASAHEALGAHRFLGMTLDNLGIALRQAGRYEEAVAAQRRALAMAREHGSRADQGRALSNLANTLTTAAACDEAVGLLHEAEAIFRDTGDRHLRAGALSGLGNALIAGGRFTEAAETLHRSIGLFRDVGNDPHGEAGAVRNLGSVLLLTGRLPEAVTHLQAAADMFQEMGDTGSEAETRTNLGDALEGAGQYEDAEHAYRAAAELFHQLDDHKGQGGAWHGLGNTLDATGRHNEAVVAHARSLAAFRAAEDVHGTVVATGRVSRALLQAGRLDEAADGYDMAVRLAREVGHPDEERNLLAGLGTTLRRLGRFEEAVAALEQAVGPDPATGGGDGTDPIVLINLKLARERVGALGEAQLQWRLGRPEIAIHVYRQAAALAVSRGDAAEHATALNDGAIVLWELGRYEEAVADLEQALEVYRKLGDHSLEAGSLTNLGVMLGHSGRPQEAAAALRRAVELYRALGEGEMEAAATENLEAVTGGAETDGAPL